MKLIKNVEGTYNLESIKEDQLDDILVGLGYCGKYGGLSGKDETSDLYDARDLIEPPETYLDQMKNKFNRERARLLITELEEFKEHVNNYLNNRIKCEKEAENKWKDKKSDKNGF